VSHRPDPLGPLLARLASVVSHELSNPLSMILNLTEEESPNFEECRRIHASGERIAELTECLRALRTLWSAPQDQQTWQQLLRIAVLLLARDLKGSLELDLRPSAQGILNRKVPQGPGMQVLLGDLSELIRKASSSGHRPSKLRAEESESGLRLTLEYRERSTSHGPADLPLTELYLSTQSDMRERPEFKLDVR